MNWYQVIKVAALEQGRLFGDGEPGVLFDPDKYPGTQKPLIDPSTVPDYDTRFSGDILEDLDNLGGLTVQYVLDHYQSDYNNVTLGKEQVFVLSHAGRKYVIYDNGSYREAHEWLYGLSESELYGYITPRDYSKDFWDDPPEVLYHGTKDEYVQSIRLSGLQAKCETRGLGNKMTGCAVFLSSGDTSVYGDVVIEVYPQMMKADGYTPFVSMEDGFDEKDALEALAHKLGIDDFNYELGDSSLYEDTVVMHDSIPPKYLRVQK